MFIEIDETSIEELERSNKQEYIDFFNEISWYLFKGINYFYISRNGLEKLYKSSKLEDSAKQRYLKQFYSSAEDKMIKETVKYKVKIVGNNFSSIIIEDNTIIIPIDKVINNINLNQKTRIIGENCNDCIFYKAIGKAFMVDRNIRGVNIELESIMGGGTAIAETYKENVINNNIAIVLIDKDIRYFECDIGRTCLELSEAINDIKDNEYSKLTKIITFDVHEIENLIPLKLIKKYYRDSRNKKEEKILETIDALEKINNAYINGKFNINPLCFFDMKKGIKKVDFSSDDKYREYWNNVLSSSGIQCDLDKTIILEGFGRNLLPNINNYISKIDFEEFCNVYLEDGYLKKNWKYIGEIIYSFGCARQRKSV